MHNRAGRTRAGRAHGSGDLGALTDEQLLHQLRGGHERVFGELFRRHHAAAVRYAANLLQRSGRADAAEDVVSDAFRKILGAVRKGNGPVDGFRSYLFVSVRAMAFDHLHRLRHEHLGEPLDEPAAEGTASPDARVALDAFRTLPRRWQEVLWATKVMSITPSEFAANAGMRANSAAALSLRAREGLRIAYVRAHLPSGRAGVCRETLDAVARRAVTAESSTESAAEHHIRTCTECRHAVEELRAQLPGAPTLTRWPAATVA